ncbi:peptidylprolyl isomerase [Paenibacillus donghaensis]|uniref:Peptidylprolyl isomerase n=1 Tax=Paenibacillus donghaensis TaxID=414771 RepID=A0A2Z2KQF0_9BACL|nr:peptidylprolyl isomerase [Paenibacillus donghaensis]ASA21088.1 peptidylprolyl isomerase [Paenibacillus donghaensis]
MDKKDLNENEHQNDNGTTEESNTFENNKAPAPADSAAAPELIKAKPAANVPVMNKVGQTPPGTPSTPGKGGKGWMITSLALAVVLIIVLIKPPFQKTDSATTVASVNGTDITKEQLYDKLLEAGGESTLQGLITTSLVDQEAEKAKVTVTDADIEAEIKDLTAQFGGEEALNAALTQSSMTLDDLKEQMPLQIKVRKILEPQIKITDEDIKKYFDENKATYNVEEQVRASHILVKTQAEADAILKQLKDGADFAALAQEKSIDPVSAAQGGDLDFFTRSMMVQEFSDAAFKLKTGDLSGVVKSEKGYHIIKATDHKDAHSYTLDEKKEEIRKLLIQKKVSEMSATWMEETTSKAKITNSLTDTDKPEVSPAASPAATAEPAKK